MQIQYNSKKKGKETKEKTLGAPQTDSGGFQI